MLSRQHNFYQQILQGIDGLIIAGSLWLAHALRLYVFNGAGWFDDRMPEPDLANYYWMILLGLPLGPLALEYTGVYRMQPPLSFRLISWRIAGGLSLVLLAIFTVVVVVHVSQVTISRAAFAFFFVLAETALVARVGLFRAWLRLRGTRSHLRNFILLCGTPEERNRWKQHFLTQPGRFFEIKAEFDLREEGLARFIETLHEQTVDIVVFSLEERMVLQVREALLACEAEGVEAWVSADFIPTLFTRVQFDRFADQPLLIYRTAPAISWELLTKRVLDLAGASLLLVVTAPLLVLLAVLIRLGTPGPVIFSQNRSGLHGRPFRMYKFRTMVTNAEQARAELAALNEMTGPVFKVENDPRVTPLGRVLRHLSLDELPQLWNVLRGEMSLVGPRPLPLYETANFGDVTQRRRMSVRPGLTCLWQVRGRNRICDFKDWVRLDLEYIDRWSLWLDMKILARTVPVVLFGWGAK